jgi:hypothetical protein
MSNPRVVLYSIDSLNLIVRVSSGVVYQNQVGGQLCVQAEQEGVLVPVDMSEEDLSKLLNFEFPQGKQGLDAKSVRFLEQFLASSPSCSFMEIDDARIDESYEAWVHVRVRQVPSFFDPSKGETYAGALYGFSGASGILTWPNSD